MAAMLCCRQKRIACSLLKGTSPLHSGTTPLSLLSKPARTSWAPITFGLIFCHLYPTGLIREVQKAEGKEVPQNSLEEYSATCSVCRDPSDSPLPQRCAKITPEEEKVDSALDVGSESPHYKGEEEVLNILPGSLYILRPLYLCLG